MENLKIFSTFTLLIFLPGYMLYRLFDLGRLRTFHVFEILPLSFVFGYSIYIIPGILSYIFNLNWMTLFLISAFIIIILFYLFFRFKKKISFPKIDHIEYFIIGFILLFIIFFHYVGHYPDASYHMRYIRKIAHFDGINASMPFFKTDSGIKNPLYSYNIWYLVVGLISKISRADVAEVWDFFPRVLPGLAIMTAFVFALNIFKERKLAFVVTMAALFEGFILNNYYGERYSYPGTLYIHLMYPRHIMEVFVLLSSFIFLLKFIESRDNKFLYLSIIAGFATISSHMFGFAVYIFQTTTFLFFNAVIKKDKFDKDIFKKFIIILSFFLILAVFLLLIKFSQNSIYNFMQINKGYLSFIRENDLSRIFGIYRPVFFNYIRDLLLMPSVLFSLTAGLIFIYRSLKKNKDYEHIFLFSNIIMILIFASPFFYLAFRPVFSGAFFQRIFGFLFSSIIAGYVVYEFLNKHAEKFVKSFKFDILLSVLMLLCLIYSGIKLDNYMCGYFVSGEEKKKTAIFNYIRDNLPPGQAYVCDQLTAERLTIFSYNYVLYDYINVFNDNELKKESADINKEVVLLNNFKKAKEYIKKYDIRYVLIPKDFNICTGYIGEKLGQGREITGYSGGGFSRYYMESGQKYHLYPQNFVLKKEDDYYKLYQVFLKR